MIENPYAGKGGALTGLDEGIKSGDIYGGLGPPKKKDPCAIYQQYVNAGTGGPAAQRANQRNLTACRQSNAPLKKK